VKKQIFIIKKQAFSSYRIMKKYSMLAFLAGISIVTACRQEATPPEAVLPVPNENQLAWYDREVYAFIHFTTNTLTGQGVGVWR
jgi:alpha-L-fucosidase